MKFKTQHKSVSMNEGGKKQNYMLHRDKNQVWATRGDGKKTATVFSKDFEFVSQAKAWMNSPDFST